jgi:hypothetical protein
MQVNLKLSLAASKAGIKFVLMMIQDHLCGMEFLEI